MLWSGSRSLRFPFAGLPVGMKFQRRDWIFCIYRKYRKSGPSCVPGYLLWSNLNAMSNGCMRSHVSSPGSHVAKNSSATRTRAQFLESPISSPTAHLLGCLCFEFCVVFDHPLARDDCASRLNVSLGPRTGSVGNEGHADAVLWVGMKLDCWNKLVAFIAIAVVHHARPATTMRLKWVVIQQGRAAAAGLIKLKSQRMRV